MIADWVWSIILALLLAQYFNQVDAGACRPTTLIMTRASGSGAFLHDDGAFKPLHPLNGVDLANVRGALKYVITEAIDIHTGVTNDTAKGECYRKNRINFIHFYKVTFCNPDDALWWFNPSRPDKYGNEPAHDFKLFGSYLTFDEGKCHESVDCEKLHGTDEQPNLKPWVGFQKQFDDPRNPTDQAYWYSIPGDCPLQEWTNKTAECIEKQKSARCESNGTPDGTSCVWTADFLGQVNLDDLSGITSIENPVTGKKYENFNEFCLAGQVEFERNPNDNTFIRGLTFYADPLDETANQNRITQLLALYADANRYPNNVAIPEVTGNAPCYQAVRQCGNGEDGRRCVRDESQVCLYCEESDEVCPTVPLSWTAKRFPELKPVSLNSTSSDGKLRGNQSKPNNDDSKTFPSKASHVKALLPFTVIITALMWLHHEHVSSW